VLVLILLLLLLLLHDWCQNQASASHKPARRRSTFLRRRHVRTWEALWSGPLPANRPGQHHLHEQQFIFLSSGSGSGSGSGSSSSSSGGGGSPPRRPFSVLAGCFMLFQHHPIRHRCRLLSRFLDGPFDGRSISFPRKVSLNDPHGTDRDQRAFFIDTGSSRRPRKREMSRK
jgi:hypothetical protein